ncbi:MAG: flavin reductase [Roseibium album]|uniref:FMN reductase (NADH) RutF n=2 Tax=Roseibium album TaxID=311410 RepID=A0A0M6ZN93_9HYPH|nr:MULTISPECIES: flavin reductase [Stappiaceae]MBG6142865.1 flavin reductase [Labrenzia sp. EL_142]MBG6158101.1 flavin reductase [Labrenzia sp. EL_162]MBG6164997.1 flavin reductase [Labrenzia sp. EL_195]MBG6172720.1 flavin reductase [Labrenzia sp. EL_132]MBG6196887.1 flavin reductase [Labrenzia sp. EL_159]MBG6202909.1 flavin reductase [Labrenzia sp. EL_13]MBG6206227.1 flavin reductase [Labrenzia sp. EL_126]MBG6227061.1 flavin reductase [Labrenzia sp. EL_208]MCR9059103.1 flavin reductase [P
MPTQDPEPSRLPLDTTSFREAMSRIAAAVHVVTTDGPGGRQGATVSAACSVSDDPASILICLNRQTRMHSAVLKNRCFCLNTLTHDHQEISDTFAGRFDLEIPDRFVKGEWTNLATGCPALDSARLSVDCDIYSVSEMGTHSIIVGTVVDLRMTDPGKSLLYVRRGYKSLDT